ncbi:MAG TPA: phosphotransferase family protein [Steroidobacteraceae bacterium]|nr:phosphotransferase family protein [Steroidobacteraceae bacterium]
MLISNERIAESILEALDRIRRRGDIAADVAYDLMVAATMLRHAQHVDTSDGQDVRRFGRESAHLLRAMRDSELMSGAERAPLREELAAVAGAADSLATSTLGGNALKRALMVFLKRMEQGFAEMATLVPHAAASLFARFTSDLLRNHNGIELTTKAVAAEPDSSAGEPLTEANLTEYFRQKLSDRTAVATKVVTLTGGFCKQTSLFTLTSQTLHGDLVMRRDNAVNLYEGLDCHAGANEYPLLRAVYSRGFPVPEPVLFEPGTRVINGPAFTIMRRVPGAVSGDATGGSSPVPADLQRVLAQLTARLHTLEPLTQLREIPAFEPSLWRKSATECTRLYIASWFRHYRENAHLPAPPLYGLFNWLLAHVPVTDEKPVLVHGDIGFHNLLFDRGKLSGMLDWEFAHTGDPAEDLGYIRSVMGSQLDWGAFIADYAAATQRSAPSEARVRFFEIWAHTRNAAASALMVDHFEVGRSRNIKNGIVMYHFMPHYMARTEALIDDFNRRSCDAVGRGTC